MSIRSIPFGAAVLLLGLLASTAPADQILITSFDFSGYAAMKANLESDGHTVDIVDSRRAIALLSWRSIASDRASQNPNCPRRATRRGWAPLATTGSRASTERACKLR